MDATFTTDLSKAVTRPRAIQEDAHRTAMRMPIDEIVRTLQEVLGQRLVAHIAGLRDVKAVGDWARGDRAPRSTAERRLRAAFQTFRILAEVESEHTVRAWFIGANPQLEEEAPADALRNDQFRNVLTAAASFAQDG